MDKRDTAENNVFFCDRCDRGFKTEEKYNEHTAQHEKVSVMSVCVCMHLNNSNDNNDCKVQPVDHLLA